MSFITLLRPLAAFAFFVATRQAGARCGHAPLQARRERLGQATPTRGTRGRQAQRADQRQRHDRWKRQMKGSPVNLAPPPLPLRSPREEG